MSSLSSLLAWCAENRVQIDSTLQIIYSQQPRERALSVYSRQRSIECSRTLVHIPKTAVLSVKSCFFSHRISSVPYGHNAHLALALALYGELLLGPHSRWFSYLQCLPLETVDIALFWGINDAVEPPACTCPPRGPLYTSAADEQRRIALSNCPSCIWLHDNQNATEWIQTTEIDHEQLALMEEVRRYYRDVVEPTFRAVSTNPGLEFDLSFCNSRDGPGDSPADTNARVYGVTLPGFCHAYSLVSTRAFWVDAYHGLAMVPIADAFNHTNDNHVQMESDYDVCIECGSLAECEHDREMGSTTVPVSPLSTVPSPSHDGTPTPSEIDYLEMRTVRPIPPFSEVFNTYGSLSNAVLLSRYGFILPENENDTVRMVLDPLSTIRSLFQRIGLEDTCVGENDHAVTGASTFGRFGVRNACREQQPYGQGFVTPSLPVPVGAWENTMNQLLHVFTYVAGMWSSDAIWDEQDDGLVFNPQSSLTGPVPLHGGDASVRIAHDLVINSDGKISHNLWLFCILVAVFAARPYLEASFQDPMEWVERGLEGIASESLLEFKARLINVQRYVERLCHIHDRESVDGDVEGGDNHGSTSSPPLPHLAASSLELDYDTVSGEFARPVATVRVQPRPGGMSISITASSGSSNLHREPFEPKVVAGQPQGPEISTSFSPISQVSSDLSRGPLLCPTRRATREPNQETSSSLMDRTSGCSAQRDRSRSAERERPPKRVRRDNDSVVVNCVDRLGRATPEPARPGRNREVLDASDDNDAETTDEATHRVALLLARVVVSLCRDRYRPPTLGKEQRGVGMTAAELGDLLDETPDCMHRTRSALVLAIGERSIVESCAARWDDVWGQWLK